MKNTRNKISFLALILLSACLTLLCGTVVAEVKPAAPAPETFISPEETTDDAVEVPKVITDIEYADGMLSVDLLNADFRKVLTLISQKAGFKLEGYSESFNKKITTRFKNIELERAVTRLLTLVSEKNYLVNYNSAGALSSIELYGSAGPPKTTTKPTPTVRPTPTGRTATSAPQRAPQPPATAPTPQPPLPDQPQPAPPEQPVAPESPPAVVETPRPAAPTAPPASRRMRFIRSQRSAAPQPPVPSQQPPDAAADVPPPPPDTPDPVPPPQQDENVQEIPYIPQKAPVFVPSRTR